MEALYLDCGGRKPQLMRDPLDGGNMASARAERLGFTFQSTSVAAGHTSLYTPPLGDRTDPLTHVAVLGPSARLRGFDVADIAR
jgi:hypothetical protein